jgi:putative hydrolase of the HAD superfamily
VVSLQAVIFDLGGTLIDWPDWDEDIERRWALSYDYLAEKLPARHWPDCGAYVRAMREAENNHWQRVREQQTSGTPTELLRAGFQRLDCQVSDQELLVALDGYGRAVMGWAIISTLQELRGRGYQLGLLSNTWWASEWHNADLAVHGLTPLLDEIVYTSDLPHSKPHPSVFQEVTWRLGVVPDACAMVGDRLIDDISGALGVGMRAVWKKTSYPWPEPEQIKPTAVITNLADLPPLIDQWERHQEGI